MAGSDASGVSGDDSTAPNDTPSAEAMPPVDMRTGWTLRGNPIQGIELAGTPSDAPDAAAEAGTGATAAPPASVTLDTDPLIADSAPSSQLPPRADGTAVIANAVIPRSVHGTNTDVPGTAGTATGAVESRATSLPARNPAATTAQGLDGMRVTPRNSNLMGDAASTRAAGKRGKSGGPGTATSSDAAAHATDLKGSTPGTDGDSTRSDHARIGKSFADSLLNEGASGDQDGKPADPAPTATPLPATQTLPTTVRAQDAPVAPILPAAPAATLDAAAAKTGSTLQDAGAQLHGTSAAETHSTVSTSRLIQTAGQTEMRVGLRSSEFGDISIRTSSTRDNLFAQISLEHADLAKSLAAHIPEMQARLGGHGGFEVNVSASSDRSFGNGSGSGSGFADSGTGSQGSAQQGGGGRSSSTSAASSSRFSGSAFAETSPVTANVANTFQSAGQNNRIDLQA